MIIENVLFVLSNYLQIKLAELWKFTAALLLLILLFPHQSFSLPESKYDEISVLFKVKDMGSVEIPSLIQEEVVYLSFCDVFDFLKIKNNPSPDFGFVEGFLIDETAHYRVDKEKNSIQYQEKVIHLKSDDLIQTGSGLYLKAEIFGEVFGLECNFNFRSLSVMMKTNLELPGIRELRQEKIRSNINRLRGNVEVDSSIGRNYSFFDLGMADWSVRATQTEKGRSETWFNLALGSMIAGGEANIALNYIKDEAFNSRQQYYNWRFVNNDHQLVRQIMAGKITTQAISSINAPVVGVQLTNAPTTYRRSFGTYTLSDFTEPGWTVELYVNNAIVDYTKSDASGFFTFEVPLVYGNSEVKLRFYGPWGEERSSEQSISVPQNILPENELEYSIGAGILEDGKSSQFSRVNINYGFSSRLTFGGGIEYLSSLTTSNKMPFLNMAFRLSSDMIFTGEYTHGVRSTGMLRVRRPSDFQMELNYTKYVKGQEAINNNYLEERRVSLSMPLRANNFSAFSRFTFNQFVLPGGKQTRAELLLSGGIMGVSTNFTTNMMYSYAAPVNVFSNLSLAFRIPGGLLVRPRVQYNYKQHEFVSVRCGLEKNLFKRAYLNLAYEQDFTTKFRMTEIGFRYDLSFARTAFSARRSKKRNTFVQSASGSLMYDSKTHYVGTNNRTSVGKGGITFLTFLDLNSNGKHEENEPKVSGLSLRAKGGRIVWNTRDSVIHLCELEPYVNYTVVLDPNSLDDIAWRIKNSTLSITVDPNQFKLVEVPVSVVGEASGTVYQQKNGGLIGQGRIIVNFYNENSEFVARTLTEEDGYFSYLGLNPGNYSARMDSVQLQKLHMTAQQADIPFTMNSNHHGDVIEGLDFTIQFDMKKDSCHLLSGIAESESNDTCQILNKKIKQVILKETSQNPIKDSVLYSRGLCVIQIGGFKIQNNALILKEKIAKIYNRPVVIFFENGLYEVQLTGFNNYHEADVLLQEIIKDGFWDAFIIRIPRDLSF